MRLTALTGSLVEGTGFWCVPVWTGSRTLGGIALGRSFRVLWLSQSISYLGSQVTVVALPLTAVLVLDAGPFEMGVLLALVRLPYLLIGLPAGALVDRVSRRGLLFVTNVALALILSVIPIASSGDWLSLRLLFVVAASAGTLIVVFELSYLAFVPELVDRTDLTRAQGLTEVTQSIGQLAGPAIAGWFVAVVSAPAAIGVDAGTYVVAAIAVLAVSTQHRPVRAQQPEPFIAGVKRSARAVFGQPVLRAVTLGNATFAFWFSAYSALSVLFFVDDLAASPTLIGVIVATGAVGGLLGAAVAPRLGERFGTGTAMAAALTVGGIGIAVLPLSSLADGVATTLAAIGAQALAWFGFQVFNVQQVPFRYVLNPSELHGRVNAMIKTVSWGAAPGGALLSGALGATIGLGPTLAICGVGAASASSWIIFGPARHVEHVANLTPVAA